MHIFHAWGKWEDLSGELNKISVFNKGVVAYGIQQRRRCSICGKVAQRIAWAHI